MGLEYQDLLKGQHSSINLVDKSVIGKHLRKLFIDQICMIISLI
jgi:hypothetical protein